MHKKTKQDLEVWMYSHAVKQILAMIPHNNF